MEERDEEEAEAEAEADGADPESVLAALQLRGETWALGNVSTFWFCVCGRVKVSFVTLLKTGPPVPAAMLGSSSHFMSLFQENSRSNHRVNQLS